MKKSKVTIGIPAFNEEVNIKSLINSILSQSTSKLKVEKIIVYSDGSSDNTNQIVRKFSSSKVILIIAKKRSGQANAQNIIFSKSDSEILVLLNADIKITDRHFLEKLISPIVKHRNVGLTSPKIISVKPQGLFENVIAYSHIRKNELFKSIENNNIYLCHGRARAFTKKLYKGFKFPNVIAEDAYSFLVAKKLGLEFQYVNATKVYFRSPGNLHDHLKQSIRFSSGVNQLNKIFGKDVINQSFKIKLDKYIVFIINFLLKSPLSAVLFVLMTLYSKVLWVISPQQNHLWQISASSKKI